VRPHMASSRRHGGTTGGYRRGGQETGGQDGRREEDRGVEGGSEICA